MIDAIGKENLSLNWGASLPEITMPASMVAAAASSHFWISCSNTATRHSCFASFVVRPDGVVCAKARRHVPTVLLTQILPLEYFYDSTKAWRERAMDGVFHSGTLCRSNFGTAPGGGDPGTAPGGGDPGDTFSRFDLMSQKDDPEL